MQRYSAGNRFWSRGLWSHGLWSHGLWSHGLWSHWLWSSKRFASRSTKNQQALRTRSQLRESSSYTHHAFDAIATLLNELFIILKHKIQQFIYVFSCNFPYLSRLSVFNPAPTLEAGAAAHPYGVCHIHRYTAGTHHPSPRCAERSALDALQAYLGCKKII
mgnify:CR=1 FL=1